MLDIDQARCGKSDTGEFGRRQHTGRVGACIGVGTGVGTGHFTRD
jgi:hypothetical protein